jgi:hypothetical protein
MESQADDTDPAATQHTNTVSTVNAANQVFGTTELLEAILEQLPPRDLLVNCSRVCRTFNTAMETSIRLRHRLFLEPAGEDWPFPRTNLVKEFGSSTNSEYPTLFDGLSFSASGRAVRMNVVKFRDFINKLGHTGSIPSAVHLTQPPTEELLTKSVCWGLTIQERHRLPDVCGLLDLCAEGGVTLGNLAKWVGEHPDLQYKHACVYWTIC